jgi:hypothetical protein
MSGWDFLDKIIAAFPPIVAGLLISAAGVVFIIGFSRHGLNFLKYGFKQIALDDSFEKRFGDFEKRFDARLDRLDARIDHLEARMDGLQSELDQIKVNYFGHLKNYLEMLNGILLDKNIITNKEKAMLDSQLRGM